MILSDCTILERLNQGPIKSKYWSADNPARIEIEPFNLDAVQGASVDLRLSNHLIYSRQDVWLDEGQYFGLPPGGSVLASTFERIYTPYDCVARVEGKSSIGRQFVVVHCTAGWCDPGFNGNITLEIVNHSATDIFLMQMYMPICQLTFLMLDKPAERQYKGRYQNAKGTEGAKQ